jgi:hypothetical protein
MCFAFTFALRTVVAARGVELVAIRNVARNPTAIHPASAESADRLLLDRIRLGLTLVSSGWRSFSSAPSHPSGPAGLVNVVQATIPVVVATALGFLTNPGARFLNVVVGLPPTR